MAAFHLIIYGRFWVITEGRCGQDNAQSHHQYVEIAGRHHRDRLSRATVGVQRSGTSMPAVHQRVLKLVGPAHGSSPRKGGRPSKAGLDARQSELAFVVARMWGTSCVSPGCQASQAEAGGSFSKKSTTLRALNRSSLVTGKRSVARGHSLAGFRRR
jgi:hypothetical protein